MQKVRGFTLIELMIAISILSMLLFTGSFVYSTIANRWDKELGDFNQHFNQTRSLILLKEVLSGVMPFVIRNNEQNNIPTMFFVGYEDSLLAVSHGGIFNTEYPEIFRLSVVERDNNKVDLIYQSASTKDIVLLDTQQEVIFDHQIVLLEGLDKVEFKYLGWESYQVKNQSTEDMGQPETSWYSSYSGVDKQLNPEIIQVSIIKGIKHIQFSVDLDQNSQVFLEHYLSDLEEQ